MTKYCKVMKIRGPVPSEVRTAGNSIDSIAQHLGLGMLGFNVAPSTNQGILMIKQEYNKYVGAEREQGNPLVFWRAGFFFFVNNLILTHS